MAYELIITNEVKKTYDSPVESFPIEIHKCNSLVEAFRIMTNYSKSCINEEKVGKLANWHEVAYNCVIFKEMYKSLWDSYYLLTYSIYEVEDKE